MTAGLATGCSPFMAAVIHQEYEQKQLFKRSTGRSRDRYWIACFALLCNAVYIFAYRKQQLCKVEKEIRTKLQNNAVTLFGTR